MIQEIKQNFLNTKNKIITISQISQKCINMAREIQFIQDSLKKQELAEKITGFAQELDKILLEIKDILNQNKNLLAQLPDHIETSRLKETNSLWQNTCKSITKRVNNILKLSQ